MMTVLTKIFYCRNTENELKSKHNKTNWSNFVLMQDSWPQLKSDSISRRKTLHNSHNSHRVSSLSWVHFAKRRRNIWTGRLDSRDNWTRIGSCNLFLHGKYGMEIPIKFVNKDNSHGSNKLVTNLNNDEQKTSEVQFEEYALKLNASDFACRSKAKAKPQRRESAGSSPRTIPIGERICWRKWNSKKKTKHLKKQLNNVQKSKKISKKGLRKKRQKKKKKKKNEKWWKKKKKKKKCEKWRKKRKNEKKKEKNEKIK